MVTVAVHNFFNAIRPRLRQFLRSMLFAGAVLIPGSCAFAMSRSSPPDLPDIGQQLASVAVNWQDPHSMVLGGTPLSARAFASGRPALEVASEFSSVGSVFQRVLTMPGQLILSGMKEQWHWIAVLKDHGSGTQGYVSVMSARPDATPDHPAWMLPEMPRGISISHAAVDQSVGQRVFHFAGSRASVRDQLEKRLALRGWKHQPGPGDIGAHWHRDGEQLTVMMFPYSGGTLVLTQQQMRGIP